MEGIMDYQKVRGEGLRDFEKVRGEGFTQAFGINWEDRDSRKVRWEGTLSI